MVQEYQSPVRVYQYAFELVMAAYEKRFPTCPMIPAFVSSETLSEFKSDDGAIHVIERKCKLNIDAPYLLKKIAGVDYVYFIQRNSLNRRDRTLKIEAWNDSFSSRVSVKEHCYYSVHPDNPDWTMFEQDASLDVKNFFGFETAVEKLAIKAYTSNLKKGKEIILHYINELESEGVTSLPRFESSVGRPRCVSNVEKQDSIESSSAVGDVIENDDVIETKTAGAATQNETTAIVRQRSVDTTEPPPLQDYKLEDSFIKRNLGELTMIEESTLMKLRRKLASTHQGKLPNDTVLLRFLRARDCNLDKAFEMLKNSLHWRRQHHVDTILSTWNPPEALFSYYPGGWHHYDKDDRPVYVIRLGSLDIKGLLKSVGAEGFVKQVVSINEEGILKCKEATATFEKPITSWVVLVDLEGLSMRHLWRPGIRALLNIIEVVEANYPETIGRLLIVRAPRVFGVVWTLLSPFIDENSRKKFLIYSGNDYQGNGGLADYLPAEYIPKFLNGPCECDIVEGSPVPKSFYRHQSPLDGHELSWLGTDLYHNASIVKGSAVDVLVAVQESEAVITWDFDVIEGDVIFSVLRHKRPREVSSNANIVTCLGETASPKVPLIRPGIDATVVEKPIVAIHGESVQGTHICQQSGVYVLQWKHCNQMQSQQRHTSRLPSKAKIMYYHEVLASQEFRGSMTSIESSQSGFSQLSSQLPTSGLVSSVTSR